MSRTREHHNADRRIEIHFAHADGVIRLEYLAAEDEAENARTALTDSGHHVIVDTDVRADLPQLPCRQLWKSA